MVGTISVPVRELGTNWPPGAHNWPLWGRAVAGRAWGIHGEYPAGVRIRRPVEVLSICAC
ncbi:MULTISPECIES: hypothetical protein [Nitrosomonas]|uniref:hypothetical protein n=1 Tax=Nitrosomonas TaxID=914 RepID=UPI0011877455|nr:MULTISPECIES: hypothetical protein [Nitrosomonas]UVS60061.1 hypothetical protein NX761_10985 [Nitrosomonas sp. PLL12]